MELLGVVFGIPVAFSFLRDYIDKKRSLFVFHILEDFHEFREIMAQDRAYVFETECFKKKSGGKEPF